MTNPGVGHNSGNTREDLAAETAEQAKALRFFMLELNKCRTQRSAVGDDEKDTKSRLKALGCGLKTVAIAKRAAGSKKEDPIDVLDKAMQLVNGDIGTAEMKELEEIRERRREISLRERELKKSAKEKGISLRGLAVVRSMQDMDGDERVEVFDAIVAYTQQLKWW